jgi:hypothetical protein
MRPTADRHMMLLCIRLAEGRRRREVLRGARGVARVWAGREGGLAHHVSTKQRRSSEMNGSDHWSGMLPYTVV